MISLDPIIQEFVSGNILFLYICYQLLRGIAKMTPWAWDDSIASLLLGVFQPVRDKKIPPPAE